MHINFIAVAVTLVVVFIWWTMLLVLRHNNFIKVGRREDKPVRDADASDRASNIRYHNEAIYKDFDFYFKVTLGILGGTAYVVTTKSAVNAPSVYSVLLQAATWFQFLSAFIHSAFVFFHQKSKIERWTERFSWWSVFAWQETYIVAVMWLVAAVYAFTIVPSLISVPNTGTP